MVTSYHVSGLQEAPQPSLAQIIQVQSSVLSYLGCGPHVHRATAAVVGRVKGGKAWATRWKKSVSARLERIQEAD